MPMHPLLTDDAAIVAAKKKHADAQDAAQRPTRTYAAARSRWEHEATTAIAAGQQPPPRPEEPDWTVLMKLREKEVEAARFVEQVTVNRAPVIEEALQQRDAELLAEVALMRTRLDEINREGALLASSVSHLDRVVGRFPNRGGLNEEMGAALVLDYHTGGQHWIVESGAVQPLSPLIVTHGTSA